VNVRIVNVTATTTDETYHLVAGKASSVRNHFNALQLELADGARQLVMAARAYDDAVAFRYLVPKQPSLQEFRLARREPNSESAKTLSSTRSSCPIFGVCMRASSSNYQRAVFPIRAE
jgi:alpha-glucosidase